MAFNNASLISLLTNSGFTLWLYRTTDTRATALAGNYFGPAASRLETGDLIILETSDAVSLTPVRASDVVASGVVLDTSAAPFRANRSVAQRFSITQAAAATVMTIVLAPLLGGFISNGTITGQASVVGAVPEVAFSISDASGATVRGPQTVSVSGGNASVTFAAPGPGSGYRMRVQATIDAAVAQTSPSFAVIAPFALLTQGNDTLLMQDGSRLLV